MVISEITAALRHRATTLLPELHAENTNCYRLFHGATEGVPGCALDRYNDLLLWQTFRDPPDIPANELLAEIEQAVKDELGLSGFRVVWNARQRRQRAGNVATHPDGDVRPLPDAHACSEVGLSYLIDIPKQGRDPNLYLDFRAARRWLHANSAGRDVLNLFSFTCGAGVAALAGGASSVVNVDHSQTALALGAQNAALNGLPEEQFSCVCADGLLALRQYAGLPVNTDRRRGRGRGRGQWGTRGRGRAGGSGSADNKPPVRLKAREFDTVVLDPPTWATSRYGTVDLVRDYQALFKPSVLATKPGGTVLACNHVHSVELDDWLEALERCAKKAGKPLAQIDVLTPEADFVSPDGRHPLKMALARVAD